MIKTNIKADVSEFQEKFELHSNIDQIAHEDIEEDRSAENLTTNPNLEEKSIGGPTIKLENKSLVPVFSQYYFSMEDSPIGIIFGDEWRIVRDCDLMVRIPYMMYPTV